VIGRFYIGKRYHILHALGCHTKIGPPKIGLAGPILAEKTAKIGPAGPILAAKTCQNRSPH